MILYLVRHGKATQKRQGRPDSWRHLTLKGRSQTKKLAEQLKKNKIKPALIMASPFVRAIQTAEILAHAIFPNKEIQIDHMLQPDSDVKLYIKSLKQFKNKKSLMIVGHEPFLSTLITSLLNLSTTMIELKKSSCVVLKLKYSPKRKTDFVCYFTPRKLNLNKNLVN